MRFIVSRDIPNGGVARTVNYTEVSEIAVFQCILTSKSSASRLNIIMMNEGSLHRCTL